MKSAQTLKKIDTHEDLFLRKKLILVKQLLSLKIAFAIPVQTAQNINNAFCNLVLYFYFATISARGLSKL